MRLGITLFRGQLAQIDNGQRHDRTPRDDTQRLPATICISGAQDFMPRRDLIHSAPDALASTANYLKGYGWQHGQPWGEGTPNFQVLLQWNASQVYTKTVAAFAAQLAGN